MTKYNQPPQSKYKDKRSSSRRRDQKQSSATADAFAEFMRDIAPAFNQFFEATAEYQERLAEIEERKANAEMKNIQAISDIIETIKSKGLKSISNSNKQKRAAKTRDEHHRKVVKIIKNKKNAGETFREIALYLEKEKIPTFSKRGKWHAQTIHRIYIDYVIS